MATVLQKRLAKAIVENSKRKKPLNKKELLVSTGYSKVSAEAYPGDIIAQKGVKAELIALGFHEDGAKKVVEEIMYNAVDPMARLKATDQVFKVQGTYAPEKHQTIIAFVIAPEDKTRIDNILNDNE